jgi:hypothetical protein
MSQAPTVLDGPDRPKPVALAGPRSWTVIVIIIVTQQWHELGVSLIFRR